MENEVFAQDDVYSAAEPTIRVLLAALAEPRPDDVRNERWTCSSFLYMPPASGVTISVNGA